MIFKLELSQEHVQIIGAALGKAPYEAVAPVIAELQKQINGQITPQPTTVQVDEAA